MFQKRLGNLFPRQARHAGRESRLSLGLLTVLFALLAIAFTFEGQRASSSNKVVVLRVDGAIVPVVADYLSRGISRAEEEQAAVAIIELNTPGGLYDTTQKIVNRILISKIPVAVYVSNWAASAGTFITLAAHVSAMAPGSRIGAAHPVSMGSSGELSETQEEKITEDAAAWVRSLAELRHHDPRVAESTVKDSRSYSDREAVEEHNLVDLRASSLPDLLSKLHAREVTLLGDRKVILNTATATVEEVGMGRMERFLLTISHPNVAYILLTLAMVGIIAELYNPGMIFPGVTGGISLLLALYSLGALDAYWGGMLLIALAFALFAAELFVTSHGLLTAGGIVSLVVGSLVLFSGSAPIFRVDPLLVAGVVVLVTAFFVFVIGAVVRAHRRPPTTGEEGIVGKIALVKTALEPQGMVFVEGENWLAILEEGKAEPGEEVIVTKIEGLRLMVRKKDR